MSCIRGACDRTMTHEIKCGRCCVDVTHGGLLRDGKPVALGNRALDILIVLASANGEIVTKDELMAKVWPGRIVEEFTVALDRTIGREQVMLSDAFNKVRNQVWLSVRRQANAAEAQHEPTAA